MRTFVVIILLSYVNINWAQTNKESILLTNGYDRIGFYTEPAFRFNINNHRGKIGLRYYTFDNFFEKNTIGLSAAYDYKFEGKNDKTFFYIGISSAFFKENKTTAQVYLTELMLSNGFGINFLNNYSFFYQLGLGIALNKSILIDVGETTTNQYYNYEMALGFAYHFKRKSK
jgi:hypothetical protein